MAEVKKADYRTSAQVAKVFGLSSKRVQQLTADGVIETIQTPKGRRYDWDSTVRQYVEYLSIKANGREKKETTAELEEAKLRAEVAIKEAKAKAAQMELNELQGKMHRAEDVEAVTTDHVLFLRSMLMALPGKLAVDLSNLRTAPEVADRIKTEVFYILENLADYQYDPAEYKKRVMERQGWEGQHGEDGD